MRRAPSILTGVLTVAALAGATAGAAAPAHAAERYRVVALAQPASTSGNPALVTGLNDRGVKVGTVPNGEDLDRGILWKTNGRRQLMPTLGGLTSAAEDVNHTGIVVGAADRADGTTRAVRWDPVRKKLRDLGALGGVTSRARAVNDRGVVVGEAVTADGVTHAFRWDPATRRMRDLGTLGGTNASAQGINRRGDVVGDAQTADGVTHAFRWDARTHRMTDLGVLPGDVVSFARDINDRGDVTGWSADVADESSKPFVWFRETRRMRPVPGLHGASAEAYALSPRGVVVGTASSPTGPAPFVWRAGHGTTLLPDLVGRRSGAALDVDAAGRVVGGATGRAGSLQPATWTRR
jgi:probable HAF family extracellular repeat protein